MKLVKAEAANYRNIIDSNAVVIGPMVCLVGKNEAGKTAFLKALEGVRSTDPNFKRYNKTENYPRRWLAAYNERHPNKEALVMTTSWELEKSDVEAVEEELGPDVLTAPIVTICKSYEQDTATWSVPIDEKKVLENLMARAGAGDESRAHLRGAASTAEALSALKAVAERTEHQAKLVAYLEKFRDGSAICAAIDILDKRTPKFMYFSHYDRMSGELSINKLNNDKQQNAISDSDRVFLDFFEYAGTSLDELVNTTKFEELNAKCEAAAIQITDQIFEYWTQNDELKIKVVLSEGKAGDPPPFNSGLVARARVENGLHGVSVPFSERSAGFIWFFSFLVKFAQIKKTHGNVILLLDEPGLTLHGTAQKDLLRYFKEQIVPEHQLIYSTHSPFMVPPDDLASVRTVEDVVERDQRGRKSSKGTKIRQDLLTTDRQTNFPVFGAIGFEVTQTLIIGKNTLLVEGPGDILYMQTASAALKAAGRTYLSPQWALCPSGGIDKVMPFVRLFFGNRLNVVVMTDYDRGQKRKLDELYKAMLLEEERILLATEFAGKSEAHIEDFFESSFYADLLNRTYNLNGSYELTAEKLERSDNNTERLVKKAEAYFRTLPDSVPEFSHFDPAQYLLQHPELLNGTTSSILKSLERFELVFKKVEAFL